MYTTVISTISNTTPIYESTNNAIIVAFIELQIKLIYIQYMYFTKRDIILHCLAI